MSKSTGIMPVTASTQIPPYQIPKPICFEFSHLAISASLLYENSFNKNLNTNSGNFGHKSKVICISRKI